MNENLDQFLEALLKFQLAIEDAKQAALEAQIVIEELRREHNAK